MTSSLTRAKDTAASRAIPTRPKDTHVGENLAGARPGVVEMGFCLCLRKKAREQESKSAGVAKVVCYITISPPRETTRDNLGRGRPLLPDCPIVLRRRRRRTTKRNCRHSHPVQAQVRYLVPIGVPGAGEEERSPTALPGRGIRIRIRRRDIKHSVKFCENCL